MSGEVGDLYGSFNSAQSAPFVQVSLVSYIQSCLESRHPIKIGLLTHVSVQGWVLGARNTKLVHVSFLLE